MTFVLTAFVLRNTEGVFRNYESLKATINIGKAAAFRFIGTHSKHPILNSISMNVFITNIIVTLV